MIRSLNLSRNNTILTIEREPPVKAEVFSNDPSSLVFSCE